MERDISTTLNKSSISRCPLRHTRPMRLLERSVPLPGLFCEDVIHLDEDEALRPEAEPEVYVLLGGGASRPAPVTLALARGEDCRHVDVILIENPAWPPPVDQNSSAASRKSPKIVV